MDERQPPARPPAQPPARPPARPPGSGALRAVDVAAVLVAAALASVYLTRQFVDGDEAVFAAIGQRIQAFGLPAYEAGWDHKPPAVFHVYAWLLSPWDRLGMLPLHAASALAWTATAGICGAVARRVLGRGAFAPAVLAYALLRSMGETKAGAANTEAFLSPFAAAGCALLVVPERRRLPWAVLGGVLLGVAALFKPNAAIFGPAAVVAAGILRGPRAALAAAAGGAVGAAVVIVPVALVLTLNGTLPDAWWLVGPANRIYMEHAPSIGPLGHAAAFWAEIRVSGPAWLFAVVGAVAAWVRPQTFGPASRVRRGVLATAVVLAASAVAVAAGSLYFKHYWWMLHPALAFAAAAGAVAVVRPSPRPALSAAAVVGLTALLWGPAQWTDKRRLAASFLFHDDVPAPYGGPAFVHAAEAIDRLTPPGSTIWVWGSNPELYVMSGRPSSSRQVSCHLLSGMHLPDVRSGAAPPTADIRPRAWETLEEDLQARPPALIVDSSPTGYRGYDRAPPSLFPRIQRVLDARFERAEMVDGYVLWVPKRR